MNALCNGHLNFVNVHPRRGGRAWTSEKRHGLRLSLMDEGGKGECVADLSCQVILTGWARRDLQQCCSQRLQPPVVLAILR